MTGATDVLRGVDRPQGRSLLARPAGGWVSQALVLVMLFVTGMAIHDLRPAGLAAGAEATAWLPWLMLAAGLSGGILSSTRLRAGTVDLLAALAGTTVSLVVVAGVVSDAPSVADRLKALEVSLATALGDTLVERLPTQESSPFLLMLAALAWTTGAYGAISVGRYARPSGAIVPIGLMLLLPVLLADLADRDSGQLLWLAIGATASLLLVLRLNLERQRVRWARRRVTGGRSVGRAFLGGGAVLVAIVTLGAVALTGIVGGAPLAAGWDRLGGILGDLGVPTGALRPPTGSIRTAFPERQRVDDQWVTSDQPVFTAHTEGGHYWIGAAYDRFDGRDWSRSDGVSTDVPAGGDIMAAAEDVPLDDFDQLLPVDATITRASLGARDLVAPQNPLDIDRDTRLWSLGTEDGPFQVLESRDPVPDGGSYQVSAAEPDLSSGGLTVSALRALGARTDPDWTASFLQVPDDVGARTRRDAERIKDGLGRGHRDRYHIAHAVQSYLRGNGFRYQVDLRGMCRPLQSITDCLLESKAGFCQQYATTMTMMLRILDVPARYVMGFLPGDELVPGEFEVTGAAAHAWVEVYFDGFGWVRFDPTPATDEAGDALLRNGQSETDLPPGEDLGPDGQGGPDGSLGPDETLGPDDTAEPSPLVEPSPSAAPSEVASPGGGIGLTLPPAGIVLLASVGMVALGVLMGVLWFLRLPGGGAERAWRGVTGLAARFGRGPTPSQTPYEYSVALARVVPRVARDIRVVADAKVESTYGPSGDAAPSPEGLRGAYARARTGLLALVLRRRPRR